MTTNDAGGPGLLLVHGRDFKPGEEQYRDLSYAAIRAGIERDYPESLYRYDAMAKELAYFGDLTNTLLESHGQHYDAQVDMGDRRNALELLRAIPARKRFGIRQYDRLPGKSALREFIANIAAPAAGAVGLTTSLLSTVSKDWAEYLRGDSEFAEAVRARIRTRLCEMLDRGDRVLLVTHGFGCIPAYEVLWELSHEAPYVDKYGSSKIDTWLTLGSPLGDNAMRRQLKGCGEVGEERFPTNIISWHNVAAEDDYTCHDKTLVDDFRLLMDKHVISTIQDYRIYNHAVRYGKSNPHSSVGYLIHPRVAKIVVDWINAKLASEEPTYII